MTSQLFPHHRTKLETESGISRDVIDERGYCSVTKQDPRLKPFDDYQRTTGYIIPVCPPDGSSVPPQLRRDVERRRQDGSTAKYEQRAGSKHRLDIHPRNHKWLQDVSKTAWVGEGIKKGDRLTSDGCFAISLGGVDCFKTPECLADWGLIKLNGRTIIICFDADAATNGNVAGARERLATFLAERGARVVILHLPFGPNGEKGIDEHLANGADLVELLAQHAVPWVPAGESDCPRDDCRAKQEQLAELCELQRAEAKVLTGRSVPANRVGPYLALLRRYWSDASPRLKHLAAEPGHPETWANAEPVVGADGWAHIPLQHWAKNELGYSYSMMLSARKELVATGLLEEIEEPAQAKDGTTYSKTLIRPKGAGSYRESVCALTTVVKPASNWGGSRWECPNDPAHKVVTKHVCASCGVDAELVTTTEPATESPPDTHFQVENGAADPLPAAPQLWDTPTNNAPPEGRFQLENGVPFPSSAPAHTSSAETGNGPPETRFQVESGSGDGQDSARVAAKAWGQSALDAAKQLNYPALYAADGRTILVKAGLTNWAATCRAAPPNIVLVATRIANALAEHERRYPL